MAAEVTGDTPARPQVQGTLFLWPDHWQVVGQLIANRPHRHISASLLVGLDRPFRLQVDGQWRLTRAALVAPDVVQALDPGMASMWIAQLDPDSDHWRALVPVAGSASSVDLDLGDGWFTAVQGQDCAGVAACLEALVSATGRAPVPLDARVRRVCDVLRRELPDRLDVGALAAEVGLSASRLTHLFRQQTGVPLRRFLLHLKMNRALAFWRPDRPVSHLAMEAGFYDQPHLVRTARNMFDALPSEYVSGGGLRVCRCHSG